MSRVLRAARIHFTSWPTSLGWPVAIMAVSFALNWAFYASIGDGISGERNVTGGLASIYVVQSVMCAQAMTQLFGFAVGLNVSRRTFFLGTSLVVLGQVIGFGALLYLLACLEQVTDGWGIRLNFFVVAPVVDGYSPLSIIAYAVPMAFMSAVGLFLGMTLKRWGTNGVFTLSVLSTVVLGGAAVLLTIADGWTAIWSWLVDQPPFALAAAWPLVLVAVFVAGTYGFMRRAVP